MSRPARLTSLRHLNQSVLVMRQVRPTLAAPLLLVALAACGDEPTGENAGGEDGRPEIVVAAPRIALVPGGSAIELPVVVRGAAGVDGIEVDALALSVGVTATVTPGPSDTVAVLQLRAADDALPNPAQFRVRATVPGRNVSDVTFVVPMRASEAQLVTFAWCASTVPTLVAARDAGDATWTRVLPDAEGRVRFALPSRRGGLAWVRADGATEAQASSIRTRVAYATAAELRALSGRESGACGGEAWNEVTGEVRGLAPGDEAQFALGTGWDVISDVSRSTFSLDVVGEGPHSLYAVRGRWAEAPWRMVADRVVIRRGVTVTDGGTVAPVDFAGGVAVVPTVGQVTVSGLLGDTAWVFGSLRDAVQSVTLSSSEEVTEGEAALLAMIMPMNLAAGERQAAMAASFRANTDRDLRGVVRWFFDFMPASLPMGPRAALPAPAGARLALPVQAEYAGSAWATFTQHDETRLREVVVELTHGYRGDATSWELAPPALAGVSGAAAWWGLEPRTVTVGWGVTSEAAWWLWTLPSAGMTSRSASAERQFAWDGTAWGASTPALRATAARGSRGRVLPVGPGRSALPGRRP